MQGEPTVMYQKPKEKRQEKTERPHQPWFNKRSEERPEPWRQVA